MQAEAELADHLHFQAARVHGILGKMPGKYRIIGRDDARAGNCLLLEADPRQTVDEQERLPVRKDALDLVPSPREGRKSVQREAAASCDAAAEARRGPRYARRPLAMTSSMMVRAVSICSRVNCEDTEMRNRRESAGTAGKSTGWRNSPRRWIS